MIRSLVFISILMVTPQVTLKDTVIGSSHFRVMRSVRHGETISLMPLMTPSFKLRRLSDEGELPVEIVSCEIIDRPMALDTNTTQERIFSVTVIRCNKVEYAVEEVDFVPDRASNEDQMSQPQGGLSQP